MGKGEFNDSGVLLSLMMEQRIKNFYKIFLSQLEALKIEHDILLKKVSQKNGEAFAGDIDYLTKEKFSSVRKKILDSGNDCVRETQALISCYDFKFNDEACREIFTTKTIKLTNYPLYKI